jgi:uncharacterized protein with von Willebrand factor type A (vWA) domain
MKKQPVEIVVIVDRSGSMDSIKKDAIGGFNTFLSEQKKVKGAANLTMILFDHEYKVVADAIPLEKAEALTDQTYVPRGMTAMNDAIGRGLSMLEAKKPKKAIVCILTDGQENASHEFTSDQVKAKIKAAEAAGWQVVYLSADVNAFNNAALLGIAPSATTQFANNGVGVRSAYTSLSASTTTYRSA